MTDKFLDSLVRLQKIEEKLANFLQSFELVFENDWEVSLNNLQDTNHFYIAESGTFLNPEVYDESNNWGNRGGLLANYRELIKALNKD